MDSNIRQNPNLGADSNIRQCHLVAGQRYVDRTIAIVNRRHISHINTIITPNCRNLFFFFSNDNATVITGLTIPLLPGIPASSEEFTLSHLHLIRCKITRLPGFPIESNHRIFSITVTHYVDHPNKRD